MLMLNKQYFRWTAWIAAMLVAVCSCTSPVQELSSYWDGHDFSSLSGFDDIKAAEDKFDGYLALLTALPQDAFEKNLRTFLDSASRNDVAYMVWAGWFASAFHSQISPYKNDGLYKIWFDMVEQDKVMDDEYMMDELRKIRQLLEHNREGDTVSDVRLYDTAGESVRLSELLGMKTLFLLVDANCPSCLKSLEENAGRYRRVKKVAVLVGGGRLHVDNIKRQLPEDVLDKWTLVCASRHALETEGQYDMSDLPVRILVASDGKILKSYH